MKDNAKILRYSVFVLSLIVIGLTICVFKKSGNKSKKKTVPINYDLLDEQKIISSKVFDILIDMADEIRNYFTTLESLNYASQSANLENFVNEKINSFVLMEVRFEQISSRLKSINSYDDIIGKIAKICLNFSCFAKRYIDIILMAKKDPNNLDITVIKSRNFAELTRDWEELQDLSSSFTEKYKRYLSSAQKADVCAKIRNKFKREVEMVVATWNEKGPEYAVTLQFKNGAGCRY